MSAVWNDAHANLNRVRKADDLADILQAAGCTAADVVDLPESSWNLATQVLAAKRGKPVDLPSDATKSLVWHRLHLRENPPANLLEGLPR
jgi:hypothetical protein